MNPEQIAREILSLSCGDDLCGVIDNRSCRCCREITTALRSAHAAGYSEAREQAVIPLEWKDMTYQGVEEWLAHHPFGSYVIKHDSRSEFPFVLKPFIAGPSNYATPDEAKAAAKADYTAKVLQSLRNMQPEPSS